jgi:deoxyribodipyrimidine photolyase
VDAVFFNRDDDPAALARDRDVAHALRRSGIGAHDFKDHVIFERDEILTAARRPYSVFTPYKRAWLAALDADALRPHPVAELAGRLAAVSSPVPTLAELGFEPGALDVATGCDAQPWFRIFNPVTQSQRFDADGAFIRRFVPELAAVPAPYVHAPWTLPGAEQHRIGCRIGRDYPAPIVDHAAMRERALALYRRHGTAA